MQRSRRGPRAGRLAIVPLGIGALVGCWGDKHYILEGTVVEVRSPTEVVVDHEEVYGLMGPMVMPFRLDPQAQALGLEPGDVLVARLRVDDGAAVLEKVRVTGSDPSKIPSDDPASGEAPVRPGAVLPTTRVPVTGGGTWTIGEGQEAPTLVTFLYTTCPLPAFCPMVTSRLQGAQAALKGTEARLLAVTIDPEGDTMDVLSDYAEKAGAEPSRWRFGRVEAEALDVLARRAGLAVMPGGGEVVHSLRWLVIDAEGRLVERYDDNAWPLDRVVEQLTTGGPPAPPGSDGTISRPPPD